MYNYLLLASGALLAEIVTRKTKAETYLLLKWKNKTKKLKIHHFYILPLSLFLLKYTDLSYLLLGIGLHDIFRELPKIRNRFKLN